MTSEREKDLQQTALRVISGFDVDLSASHQSISFVGLGEFRRDVSISEFVEVLLS